MADALVQWQRMHGSRGVRSKRAWAALADSVTVGQNDTNWHKDHHQEVVSKYKLINHEPASTNKQLAWRDDNGIKGMYQARSCTRMLWRA